MGKFYRVAEKAGLLSAAGRPARLRSSFEGGSAMSEIGRTLWTQVKARLSAKLAELRAEVRAYPTPIARCDDQLPKLLDRRAAAQRRVRLAEDQVVDGFDDARLAALIEEFTGGDDDDPELAALRREARALLTRRVGSGA